jgi:hypothetical protein
MRRHHSGLDPSSLIADCCAASTMAGLLAGGGLEGRLWQGQRVAWAASNQPHQAQTCYGTAIVPRSAVTRRFWNPKTFLGIVPCRCLLMNDHKGYLMHGLGAVVVMMTMVDRLPAVDDRSLFALSCFVLGKPLQRYHRYK